MAPLPKTMKAVVFHGPKQVALETRPVPSIASQGDAIIKVQHTALCGSELHVYRGHQPSGTGFVMGHEFTGTIVAIGSGVKGFRVGDAVVSPFTTSCGSCFYCKRRQSSRCAAGALFGSAGLDGAQAEFVRVPLADSTLVRAPPGVAATALVLMADIWPTGWFGARNALSHMADDERAEAVVVVVGCGPVGLCALVNVLGYEPKHVLAVDGVEDRLDKARALGAEGWNYLTQRELLDHRVKELTDGRGADAVVEVVGLSPALRLGFELLRPWGTIASVGVHNAEVPFTGNEAYNKNLRIQFGRCPVRSVFEDALAALVEKQHLLGFMGENIMSLDKAVEGYEAFDQMKVQKGLCTVIVGESC